MGWLLFCFTIAPVFSFFYRPITSGTCDAAGCSSMGANQCEDAFKLMEASSKTANSPTVRYYLEETDNNRRPHGCIADFNLTKASLHYNEGWTTGSATITDPVYCICDDEAKYVERDEFEDASEWCDGWLGDVEIDPTRSWVESGEDGTPSVGYRNLGGEMAMSSVGLVFQPGPGFLASSVVSIGIRFKAIPYGVEFVVTLLGCPASFVLTSNSIVCDTETETSSDVFTGVLSPGRGEQDLVYFMDTVDISLSPDWTYFLEFAYPEPLPATDGDDTDAFWSVRLPVYHPILEDPWDYVFEKTTYFQSVKPYGLELHTTDDYQEILPLPQILFKLCTPGDTDAKGCTVSAFFSFQCNQWIIVVLILAILVAIFCCIRCYCWLSPQPKGVVCLNFVNYDTGRRWFRKGVPLSHPIKLLTFDVADMLSVPRESTSLWLRTGQRLRWCYRVGQYRLSPSQDIWVVQRPCNHLCGCCSIEDLCGVCIPAPDFSRAVDPRSCQSARLISQNGYRQNVTEMPRYKM